MKRFRRSEQSTARSVQFSFVGTRASAALYIRYINCTLPSDSCTLYKTLRFSLKRGIAVSSLQTVYQEMQAFFQPLWPGEDKPLVLGEGKSDGPVLMLIGEAPGETEVLKRRPFVGKAGKNLDEFLSLAQLRREDIFVSNVVKIRPAEIGPTGRMRNRAPNREELSLFTPWLLKEIQAVKPLALVTLGNVPLKALTNAKASVGDCHGQWFSSQSGIPLFSLYHPASIIYRRALAPVYEQDVLALRQSLVEKQTGAAAP